MKKKVRYYAQIAVLTMAIMIIGLFVVDFPVKAAADENGINSFVTRLYSVCLDREADADGLSYWSNMLIEKKGTGISVAYGFVFSKEFQSRGFSNEEYVKHMYEAFFGREADQGGLDYWVGKLENGGTKKDVFLGFANSEEFYNLCKEYGVIRGVYFKDYDVNQTAQINLFVERLYSEILGRGSDRNGFVDWSYKLITRKTTGAEAAYGFVFSKEVSDKKLSNEDFIIMLYGAFLGRTPDEAGKWGWINKLDLSHRAGSTELIFGRKDAFAGFVGSKEFAGICKEYGIGTGYNSLPNPSAPHNHNYVYAERSEKLDALILDPAIETSGYVYGDFSADYLRGYDFPECNAILGSGGPGSVVYNGIFKAGRKIDDTHFEINDQGSGLDNLSGDMKLVTDQIGPIIDLTKLDWYCIHRGETTYYECSICGDVKDKTFYGGSSWPSIGDCNDRNNSHAKNCTCYDKIAEQYGVLFVKGREDLHIEEIDGQSFSTYKTIPYEITFSRCKHENVTEYIYKYKDFYKGELKDYTASVWRASSYNTFYQTGDKQYYLECLDCGAILPDYEY